MEKYYVTATIDQTESSWPQARALPKAVPEFTVDAFNTKLILE